jgi:integrase
MSDTPLTDWPLEKILRDEMVGRLAPKTFKKYLTACRRYYRFRGGEQRAYEVTRRLLELFTDWQRDQGHSEHDLLKATFAIAAIVRFADPELIPLLHGSEYMTGEAGTLQYILEHDYFPQRSKIASVKTENQYKFAVSRYSKFLGRHATLDDLNDRSLGRWMRAMRDDGLAATTVNGYLNKLRAFWTWCAKQRKVDKFPTIEDLPEPQRIPRAWTEQQMRALVAACSKMTGKVGDAPAGVWWRCLHLVAFDTGERCSALLSLRWRDYDPDDGTLEAPAEIRKGGRKPMLYRLKPATAAALQALPRDGVAIFRWPHCIETFYNRYKRLLKLAGLPHEPRKSGMQKVRRTFASHIENAGGNATVALGHTARKVTEQSYLDPRIIRTDPPNALLFDLDATA